MKASHASIFAAAAVLGTPFFPLAAQQSDPTPDAVKNLNASRSFTEVSALPASKGSDIPDVSLSPKSAVTDNSAAFDKDPLRQDPLHIGFLFKAPTPEQIAPPEVPVDFGKSKVLRKPILPGTNDDSDWLVKGVEEQQKWMADREKALAEKRQRNATNNFDLFDSNGVRKQKQSTYSALIGGKVFSRYTTNGVDSLSSLNDASKLVGDRRTGSKSGLAGGEGTATDSATTAVVAQNTALINDPISMTKSSMNTSSWTELSKSRLSVDEWIRSLKAQEKQAQKLKSPSLLMRPSDEKSGNTVASETLPQTPTYTRPTAQSQKSSLPPNRQIKDPNDY
jgi:hypothetical protein